MAPDGRKVGLAAGAETFGQIENCMLLWCEAHWELKSVKAHHSRTTFGIWNVEKDNAVVGQSTLGSENVQKHTRIGPLLDVEMSKMSTPLWGKAHLEVKMCKTHKGRTTFGRPDVVQMWKKCTPLWREGYFQVKSVTAAGCKPILRCQLLT